MKKPNKILAIDVGNTTISYALFQSSKILVHNYVDNGNIPTLMNKILRNGVNSQYNVILSSVVPQKSSKIKKALRSRFKQIKIWSIGENVHLNVKMSYVRKSLGSDRLVNIYGAIQKYKVPLLIIDYGTAITFDYVSKDRIFLGGLIVPGLETSWRALQERAVLLPKHLNLKPVAKLTPTDTKSAMFSGLLNGFGAMTDGLITRYKKKFGKSLTVLATGGASPLISKYCQGIDLIDPLHTLRSLDLVYLKLVSTRS